MSSPAHLRQQLRSPVQCAYSPFGSSATADRSSFLAFCGHYRDAQAGAYPLGNGHRHYSPTLMRFRSADSLSPFGRGGVNAYAYCLNDPINFVDPSGRFLQYAGAVRSLLSNALNLGITALKYARDIKIARRYFSTDPEFAASRHGHVNTGAIEADVPRLTLMQKVLLVIGGGTASVGVITAGLRMIGVNHPAVLYLDLAIGSIATIASGVEVVQLHRTQLASRYPVYPDPGQIRPFESQQGAQEWRFNTGSSPVNSIAIVQENIRQDRERV